MTEAAAELIQLFENEICDYDRCRALIREIGGCTKIIPDGNFKTTPLHEAVSGGHYDFAMELIREPGADLNVASDWCGPLMWELQYLWTETEAEQWKESEQRLRLVRALIEAGADPNPVLDGEELLYYVRYEVNEKEGDKPQWAHWWWMEHIVEAHAYGQTERFFEKVRTVPVDAVLVFQSGLWMIDDDLCESDHAIFVFADGERMALSSYQVDDEEWDFYAVPVHEDLKLKPEAYKSILPAEGKIGYIAKEDEAEFSSHYLRLSIDDGALLLHAEEGTVCFGVVELMEFNYENQKRKDLFIDEK